MTASRDATSADFPAILQPNQESEQTSCAILDLTRKVDFQNIRQSVGVRAKLLRNS